MNPNGVTKKKERLPTESLKSDDSLMTFSRMRSEKCSEGLGFESQRSHEKERRLPTESLKSDDSLMTFSRMRSEKCSEGLGFESQRSH